MGKLTPMQEIEVGMEWICENQETWNILRGMVERDAKKQKAPIRLSRYVERLRACGMSFRNTAAPYVARRLARDTGAIMSISFSKIDELMGEM